MELNTDVTLTTHLDPIALKSKRRNNEVQVTLHFWRQGRAKVLNF